MIGNRTAIVGGHAREVFGALTTVARAATGGPRARGGVALLIDHTGRMLFVHARYRKQWNLAGGFLNPVEDPVAGIRRELTEEIAFPPEAPSPPLALIIHRKNHDEHVAVAQLDRATAIRLHVVTWELRGFRWCTPVDMPQLNDFTRYLLDPNLGLVVAEGNRWRVAPTSEQGVNPT